jgi:DNA-binding transcriptional ArsR family regulator
MESETSGCALAPAVRKNLPLRILRAIDNALHLSGLPRCLRATFAEIARFVPQQEPFATVFAHKDKIAARIGATERTIYSHLAALKDAGLIERLPQERKSRNGRYSVARVRLTRQGAALLGLIENDVIHSQQSAEISCGHTLTEPTITKNQPASSISGVPADLVCLAQNGVSRPGIFALMRKATAKGKRLSDIALVAARNIAPIRGGRLFCYLAKLADGPSNFAERAGLERQRQREADAAQRAAARAAHFRQRFAGCALTDRAHGILHRFDDACRFVQTTAPGYAGTAPLNDLSAWMAAIDSGRLVLATIDVERRLAQN